MKRTSLILLICIYSFSTYGVSLKKFYCCSNLNSVSVTLADDAKDKCSKDGCCKTKYKFFKVNDKHLANSELFTSVKYYTDLFSFTPSYQSISFPKQVDIFNDCHAPPLYLGVPIYISNCVFRI